MNPRNTSDAPAYGIAQLRVSLGVMWVALGLVPILAVAAWVHAGNGWAHTSPNGGWEYPVFLLVASVALWLLGDGALAVRRSAWLVPVQRSGTP